MNNIFKTGDNIDSAAAFRSQGEYKNLFPHAVVLSKRLQYGETRFIFPLTANRKKQFFFHISPCCKLAFLEPQRNDLWCESSPVMRSSTGERAACDSITGPDLTQAILSDTRPYWPEETNHTRYQMFPPSAQPIRCHQLCKPDSKQCGTCGMLWSDMSNIQRAHSCFGFYQYWAEQSFLHGLYTINSIITSTEGVRSFLQPRSNGTKIRIPKCKAGINSVSPS